MKIKSNFLKIGTHDMTTTSQTIGGKNGKLVEDRSLGSPSYTFWYIENGVEINIHG